MKILKTKGNVEKQDLTSYSSGSMGGLVIKGSLITIESYFMFDLNEIVYSPFLPSWFFQRKQEEKGYLIMQE